MFLVSCLPKFEYDPSKTFRGFISKILSYKTFEHWRGSKKAQPSESVAHRMLADKHSFQDILELLCENELKLHAEIILKEAKARAIKRGFHESTWQAWEGVFLKNKGYPTLANEMSLPESTLYAKVSSALQSDSQSLNCLSTVASFAFAFTCCRVAHLAKTTAVAHSRP